MARIIQAVSIGCRVPEAGFHAAAHSVFHSAANFAVDGLEHLLTLFTSNNTDLPQGIRLPAGSEWVFQHLEPGQAVQCASGMLRAGGWVVDLRGARRYATQFPHLGQAQPPEQARTAWRTAWRALAEAQSEKRADLRVTDLEPESAGNAPAGAAGPLRALRASARRLDREQAGQSVDALVGLGGGLTPTGDDVLVGFLAGLRAVQPDQARAAWLDGLSQQVRAISRKTNDISRSYLWLAAEGQFSSSLADLAAALYSGAAPESVREAAAVVFATGHTSGLDAATGLLTALSAWNEDIFSNQNRSDKGEQQA